MAKGNGIVSLITGKFGNLVGYRNTNSNNRETQAIRAYVAQVFNPKSSNQALQRVKLTPAQNFYRAFQDPLDHAFQNVKFGQRNRQRFISLAMKQPSFPGVVKGSRVIPAFPYQISEGSLPIEVRAAAYAAQGTGSVGFPTFNVDGMTITADMTIGAFSQALLANNPQLENGDELHFMALVHYVPEDANVTHQFTIVLNTEDTLTKIEDVIGGQPLTFGLSDPLMNISATGNGNDYVLFGAGLIVSRRYQSGWQYSTSFFGCSQAGDAAFNTPELRAAAAESYAAGASELTSDRTLQQADNETINQGVVVRSLSTTTFALTPALIAAGWTAATNTCTVAVMSDGTRRVVVKSQSNHRLCPVRYDDGVGYVTINRTHSGTTPRNEPIAMEDTTLFGNTTINVNDLPFV